MKAYIYEYTITVSLKIGANKDAIQLYYYACEVNQVPIKYIISDSGVIHETIGQKAGNAGNAEDPDRIISFEFNPAAGQEALTCEAGEDATASDLVLSSIAILLGVYQALRRSSGEEDAEIMRQHITSLVNNPDFWSYHQHQDDAIDFTDLKIFRS